MNFVDKSLTCADCGSEFTFTAGEQEFHAQKGFTNDPRRCPTCRASRRTQRDSYGSGSYSSAGGTGGGYGGGSREMFSATCASCGKEARVPFEPRGDKPVYCSDCFRSKSSTGGSSYGGGSSGGGRRGGGDRW